MSVVQAESRLELVRYQAKVRDKFIRLFKEEELFDKDDLNGHLTDLDLEEYNPKYRVTGTMEFTITVEADNRDDAESKADELELSANMDGLLDVEETSVSVSEVEEEDE